MDIVFFYSLEKEWKEGLNLQHSAIVLMWILKIFPTCQKIAPAYLILSLPLSGRCTRIFQNLCKQAWSEETWLWIRNEMWHAVSHFTYCQFFLQQQVIKRGVFLVPIPSRWCHQHARSLSSPLPIQPSDHQQSQCPLESWLLLESYEQLTWGLCWGHAIVAVSDCSFHACVFISSASSVFSACFFFFRAQKSRKNNRLPWKEKLVTAWK